MRDGGVHHGVVAGRAERDPGRACDAGAGHDLGQRHVDDPGAAGSLVDGGDAEAGESRVVGHSASTTTGISRWNASA